MDFVVLQPAPTPIYGTNWGYSPHRWDYSRGIHWAPFCLLLFFNDMIYTDEECADLSHNAWYLDDGSLAGKSAPVLRALNIVSSQGPALGFNINLKKCELYGGAGLRTLFIPQCN